MLQLSLELIGMTRTDRCLSVCVFKETGHLKSKLIKSCVTVFWVFIFSMGNGFDCSYTCNFPKE